MSPALIITYHAVDGGPPPLSLAPELLRDQLDQVTGSGAAVLTLRELAAALRGGALPDRAVALTFDDAFASVAEHAGPLLAERGLRATVFPVAGAIGGTNAGPSQPAGGRRARLADAGQLAALAAAGWEVGSHGTEHAPLSRATDATAQRELLDSRSALEQLLQVRVDSFALPYGDPPGPHARALLRKAYSAACTTRLALARGETDPWAVPRIDAHYLRRPELLARALEGSPGTYLRIRGVAARARRIVRKDYVWARR